VIISAEINRPRTGSSDSEKWRDDKGLGLVCTDCNK
jgi:hypothetical protein